MSMKSRLATAALLTLVAMSAVASPASAAAKRCDEGVWRTGCGVYFHFVEPGRRQSTVNIKAVDTRDQAMMNAGGGGGGGGGGGR
jgi:hypothetical protein